MNRINYWIMATRPKTLFAGIGPVILALAFSYHHFQKIDFLSAFITCLCAILLQVSSNLINDYYDGLRGIDGEDRLGPKRVLAQSLITPKSLKKGFCLTLLLALVLGVYIMRIGGPPIIIIGMLSLVFAWAYTGGPIPLSHYALGEILALLFFGPMAVWGTFYIQKVQFETPLSSVNQFVFILGLGPGFISAAIMAINNLRDRKQDKKVHKMTLATLLSEKMARYLVLFFLLASISIPLYFFFFIYKNSLELIPAVLTPFLFILNWKTILQAPISEEFNKVLAKTGLYLFVYSLFFSIGFLCL